MTTLKYYDLPNGCPIDLKNCLSSVTYADWQTGQSGHSCARHPDGFWVFIDPAKLSTSDEYASGDPYKVESNITSSFQQRRLLGTIDLIPRLIETSGRLLDIGCGEGHITGMISQAYPKIDVSGIDQSVTAIQRAVTNFSDIDFAVGDAYALPYVDGYFDAVVCNNLWEHVPDPLRLLSSISRITKAGGTILLSTPSRYRLGNLLRVLRGKTVAMQSKFHVTEYSVGQIKEQLTFGGYELFEIYAPPLRSQECNTPKAWFLYYLVYPTIRTLLRALKSHHSIESTVFFLARKKEYSA